VVQRADETEEAGKEKGFRFEISELNVTLPTDSNTSRTLYLHNNGEEDLRNISISLSKTLSKYLSLSVNEINELEKDESSKIEVYFSSDSEERIIKGQITAKYTNGSKTIYAYSSVFLNFIEGFMPLNKTGEKEIKESELLKECSEMNGRICDAEGEKCEGESKYAKDGICCISNKCVKIEKSSKGKFIGWGIIITVLLFLAWFFKFKYRRTKKEVDLFKIAGRKR